MQDGKYWLSVFRLRIVSLVTAFLVAMRLSNADCPARPVYTLDALTKCQASVSGREDLFYFREWDGPEIKCYIYLPEEHAEQTTVLFVMHGVDRNSGGYFKEWLPYARENAMILVVPRFSKNGFQGTHMYQLGNTFSKGGVVNPPDRWSYTAVELIFSYVQKAYQISQPQYVIYGHSAGAQFVHRFVLHVPDSRAKLAIAANAGWYTQPTVDVDWPYGLNNSAVKPESLQRSFQKQLVILLGSEDTDPNCQFLRRTAKADKQGINRFERGLNFLRVGRAVSEQLFQQRCTWRHVVADGVGHVNHGMAKHAVALIFSEKDDPPSDTTNHPL